jgi:SpoVK/Ycf46/Vps4 family AAA+-type ATPase
MIIKEKNTYTIIDSSTTETCDTVDPGVYNLNIKRSMMGTRLELTTTNTFKNTKQFNRGVFKEVNDYVDNFLCKESYEANRLLGIPHRLGLLFTGDPGTGKTMAAGNIGERLVKEHGAIVIVTTERLDKIFKDVIEGARANNPDQLIVLISDEFEKTYDFEYEVDSLSFLDGKDSVDNILFIGTTNSLKDFSDKILKRPGRFEKTFTFSYEKTEVLESIIETLLPDGFKTKEIISEILNLLNKEEIKTVDIIRVVIRKYLVKHINLN